MKNEEGVVRSVTNGKAFVEINNISSEECARCGVCVSEGDTSRLVDVESVPGLEAGDRVILKIDSPSIYKSLTLIFFLPIVSFIVGCIIATKIDFILPEANNARMGLTGLFFFLVSIGSAALYDRVARKKLLPPEIVSVENKEFGIMGSEYVEGY
ncbi:MAG: SoxR reducing system RseC family protein [Planctomycetota bacterium]|jgi:positive regulator of sigma E activity